MITCKTGVRTGLASPMFKDCGEPATELVLVGSILCRYCPTHAEEARRYVEKQTQAKIAETQRRMRVAK